MQGLLTVIGTTRPRRNRFIILTINFYIKEHLPSKIKAIFKFVFINERLIRHGVDTRQKFLKIIFKNMYFFNSTNSPAPNLNPNHPTKNEKTEKKIFLATSVSLYRSHVQVPHSLTLVLPSQFYHNSSQVQKNFLQHLLDWFEIRIRLIHTFKMLSKPACIQIFLPSV